MQIHLPSWLARRLNKNEPVLEISLADAFADMPEGLKTFLIYACIFLFGGLLFLFLLAAIMLY